NFALNQSQATVRACSREQVQADAFEWLAKRTKCLFDLIVLDPPSLAKRETERAGATLAYFKLASVGIARLAPAGILLSCSCSAHVSDQEFYQAVSHAAVQSKRRFREILRSGQPPDHPAAFEEAKYLK